MKTSLASNRDFLAGLMFIAIGAGGFYVALSYPFGNVQQMGPGFFPRVLGAILVGVAGLVSRRILGAPVRRLIGGRVFVGVALVSRILVLILVAVRVGRLK
mgnify:CR=1 FL=1